MQVKTLLVICLSFIGCASCKESRTIPSKPSGLLCTLYKGVFYCNDMLNPELNYEYDSGFEMFNKAQCFPLDTFERYTKYVSDLKAIAEKGCR